RLLEHFQARFDTPRPGRPARRLQGERCLRAALQGYHRRHGSPEELLSMAATVHDEDKLRELDDGERRAWQAYSQRLRDLTGAEYERVESESWAELQRELR